MSAGFRIWNEHIKLSSTDIIAPESGQNSISQPSYRGSINPDRKTLTCIVEFTAIVGGGEQGDQLPLGKELVAILDHLMGAANQVELMFPQEFRYDL